MAKKKKKTTKPETEEVEELVLEDEEPVVALPSDRKKDPAAGVEITVYFSAKKIRKGHHPGMIAYAEQKLGKSIRRLNLTFEEWVEIFSTY